MNEYSFFIIKPQAMIYADSIFYDLEVTYCLTIVEKKMVKLTEDMVKNIYPKTQGLLMAVIIEKDSNQDCWFCKVSGENVIQRLLDACGLETNPLLCNTGTIRHTYGNMDDFLKVDGKMFYGNIVHRPRNLKEVQRDEKIFNQFPPG